MRTVNSRLDRLEEKRSARKAVLLSLATILLILMGAIFGIPALIKIVVFVGDLNSANKPVDKTDTIAPVPPNLYSAFTATNSANLALDGLAEPGSTVYLTDNGNPVVNVVTADDGTFHIANVNLTEGANIFKAVAMDQSNNTSGPSKPVSVFFSMKQPKLEVETPTDGQKINNNTAYFDVKGSTDPGNRILVNERVAVVDGGGKWMFRVGLANGDNTISVIAADAAGNNTKKEIKVSYIPQ